MEKIIWLEIAVVVLGSAISFAFPAGATILGGLHAGFAGGTLAWVVSSIFVVFIFFPSLGKFLDLILSTAARR